LAFILLLIADYLESERSGDNIAKAIYENFVSIYLPDTQWMAVICFVLYLLIFLYFHNKKKSQPHLFWLLAFIFVALTNYGLSYPKSANSRQLPMLIASIALAQGMVFYKSRHASSECQPHKKIILMMIMLLVIASVWHPELSQDFQYHRVRRWTGPWENPNTYGSLMGLCLELSVGLSICGAIAQLSGRHRLKENSHIGLLPFSKGKWKRYVILVVCTIAGIFASIGLLHSYSRGAWLAALCGLSYIVFQVFKTLGLQSRVIQHIRQNARKLVLLVCAVSILAFWQYQQSEWLPVRRALSASNVNDFSWRNRLAGWEGCMQMIACRPWFGLGWNQPEQVYAYYYRDNKLNEGASVQLNDYLSLGTTLGLPALGCFMTYVWLRLRRDEETVHTQVNPHLDHLLSDERRENHDGAWVAVVESLWLKRVCRAGVIVLLIGFFFDGGLLTLPTTAPFWILLELGSSSLPLET